MVVGLMVIKFLKNKIMPTISNNSVGIGEHPQIMDEMEQQLGIVADCDGKLTLEI